MVSVAMSFNKATNQQTPSAGSKCRSDVIHEEGPNQAMMQHERAGEIEETYFRGDGTREGLKTQQHNELPQPVSHNQVALGNYE